MRNPVKSLKPALLVALLLLAVFSPLDNANSQAPDFGDNPCLEVTPNPLHFYINTCATELIPETLYINITNCGGGTLEWIITPHAWFDFSATTGIDNEEIEVSLKPDTLEYLVDSLMPQNGDTIVVTVTSIIEAPGADNSPVSMSYTLHFCCNCDAGEVILASEPTSFEFHLDYGNSVMGENLFIYEVHGRNIGFWTVLSTESAWLQVDSFPSVPLVTPDTVYLNINTSSLDPGIYTDTILVNSYHASNSLAIPVTLHFAVHEYDVQAQPAHFYLNLPLGEGAESFLYVHELYSRHVPFNLTFSESWLETSTLSPGPPYQTPVTFTVNFNTWELEAGIYTDFIVITPASDAMPFDSVLVPVTITIYESPTLVVTPDHFSITLNAGEIAQYLSLHVYEAHGDTISFAYEKMLGSEWLFIDDTAGYSWTPDSALFDVYTYGLEAGVYSDTILIYTPWDGTPDSTVKVPIVLTVGGVTPVLMVDPLEFNFTAVPDDTLYDSLHVYELNGGEMLFDVSLYYGDWLSIPQYFGPLYTPEVIPLTVFTEGLAFGEYFDTIEVRGYIDPQEPPAYEYQLTVRLVVDNTGHVLIASPPSFDLIVPPESSDSAVVHVSELHGANVQCALDNNTSWLLLPEYFVAPITPFYLTFWVHTDSLPLGEYYDTIFVQAFSDPPGEQLYIPVKLTVAYEGNTMVVDPPSFSFLSGQDEIIHDSLRVSEMHGYPLYVEAVTYYGDWLTITEYPEPVPAPEVVQLTINTAGLAYGYYYDTIEVRGYDNPSEPHHDHERDVEVMLAVDSAGYRFVVTPSSFDWITPPGTSFEDQFNIHEIHGAQLDIYWTYDAPWLFLPIFIVPPQTPAEIVFTVSAEGLSPGVYVDVIHLYGYANQAGPPVCQYDLPVVLTVSEDITAIATVPTEYDFVLSPGDSVIGESLFVYEVGGQSINFWTYNYTTWLEVDTMDASPLFTPEQIWINVRTGDLAPGVYSDTIVIDTYDAANTPYLIPVNLAVVEDTFLYIIETIPESFHFYIDEGGHAYDTLTVTEYFGRSAPFLLSWDEAWMYVYGEGGPPYFTPQDLTIYVGDSTPGPGRYADTIWILPDPVHDFHHFDPVAVPVWLTVGSQYPVVRAAPDHFEFTLETGVTLSDIIILVYEESGLNLLFEVATMPGSDWLSVQPKDSPRYTGDSVYFDITTAGLEPGVYSDTVIIFYPLDDTLWYDDVKVPVVLTITGEQPDYVVHTLPTSLSYSGMDGAIYDSLYVYEELERSVPFMAYNQQPWLVIDDYYWIPPLFTPMWLQLLVNIDTMPAGVYFDTIFILPDADVMMFPPVAVPVMLAVDGAYVPGDPNRDGNVNLLDILYLVDYLYSTPPGALPNPLESGDINGNGDVDLLDILYLIDFLYGDPSGPPPVQP
ncbi:MAG: hypothetical protein JSV44_11725 [Candidatus Zixiibacteriota bacterium]|nr:MAG: hypothetical protein JSV44_11725 [candidate division Zixibacteria bacterium]